MKSPIFSSRPSVTREERNHGAGGPISPSRWQVHDRPGLGIESAAHLEVLKSDESIDDEHDARCVALLERVVAMLTRMVEL